MAETVGELEVTLDLDDSGMQDGEGRATGRFSRLTDSLKGLAAAGAVGIGAMLAGGVADAMDMQAANAKLSASLGASGDEAARLGKIQGAVYASGWGESLEDVGTSVSSVVSAIGDMGEYSDAGLQQLTQSAMALGQAFEMDVGEGATAAGALVKQGLVDDVDEAFDVMTVAAQSLPKSMVADLPAIVTEYGSHFKRIGLDAQTSFGLMSQYVNAGGKDLDQAADVLHEFGRITSEETARASQGFQSLGLDSAQMLSDLGKGGPAAAGALQKTLDALRGVEDPAKRAQLQVALFGDMAGESVDALLAMNPATAQAASGLDNTSGAAARLTEQMGGGAAQSLESLKRQFQVGLSSALMQFLPLITQATTWISQNSGVVKALAIPVIAALGVAALVMGAQMAAGWIAAMGPVGWVIAGIAALAALIITNWETIKGATSAAWSAVSGAVSGAARFVLDWLSSNWPKILAILTGPIGLAVLAIVSNWDKIKEATGAAWSWVTGKISEATGAVVGAVTGAASAAGQKITDLVGWFGELPGRVKDKLSDAKSWLVEIGKDIVRGCMDGIGQMAGALMDKAKSVVTAPVRAAKGWLGIGSPSKVWRDEVGKWIPAGVADGVEGGTGLVHQAVQRLSAVATPSGAAALAGAVGGGLAAAAARPGGGGGGTGGVAVNLHGPVYADSSGIARLGREVASHVRDALDDYGTSNGSIFMSGAA